ncbi:methanogen output domain 1-containing protein [Bailinhaonella thermotolerans]|uniref:Transcriptional regulator n=1 Tax=Bailinhaonella thermotolerans TaxID=1070861 RepID=A0A3A4AUF1_9ACTN|nr:methanogen output domain 1-containing protein [Bailinhaonella thermotolerans]RJL33195.1 transcriptional regulator [Bailinhaonella thermotolerans]
MSGVESLDLGYERDGFMRALIRELAGTLEEIVGVEEAAGYISLVSQRTGDAVNERYLKALAVDKIDREQIADVLVDLKRRIQGDFYVIEESDEKIVLGNRACPFGEEVRGRDSMCMLTSNMFGVIAAQNLGYAKVELRQTIARGAASCRVAVYLRTTEEAARAPGREYYGDLSETEPVGR